jgi:hypothetical protein
MQRIVSRNFRLRDQNTKSSIFYAIEAPLALFVGLGIRMILALWTNVRKIGPDLT